MKALIQKLKAAEALARLERLEAKTHLSHTDLHKRDRYVADLVGIGLPAVPLLVRKLARVEDGDPSAAVPMILQQIGDPAVPQLARAMHARDVHLRHNAISVLGRMATPAAVCALDDDSVDLMDMEVLQHARLKARHRGQDPTSEDLSGTPDNAWLHRGAR